MKTIITIQHTQSVHHLNGMVGSWTDWPLTELGIQQAEKIGGNLKAEFAGTPFVLYTSDLLRARQTTQAVGRHLGIVPVERTELRERNVGRACGQSVQWLRENIETPEITVDDRLFSDGESRRDAWNRLRPFYDEMMESGDQNIIIVSHGDILGIFHAMFFGVSVEDLNDRRMHGAAGSVSLLQVWDDGKHAIRRLSDMSYLK